MKKISFITAVPSMLSFSYFHMKTLKWIFKCIAFRMTINLAQVLFGYIILPRK